jgi:hypothetical protein
MGRTLDLRGQMQPRKKLTQRVQTHSALEAERIKGGYDEARQPLPAVCRFPQSRFRMAIAALQRVLKAMHTALRQSGLLRHTADALPTMITKALENPQTFRPKSHGGRASEEGLNSCRNSVLQRT